MISATWVVSLWWSSRTRTWWSGFFVPRYQGQEQTVCLYEVRFNSRSHMKPILAPRSEEFCALPVGLLVLLFVSFFMQRASSSYWLAFSVRPKLFHDYVITRYRPILRRLLNVKAMISWLCPRGKLTLLAKLISGTTASPILRWVDFSACNFLWRSKNAFCLKESKFSFAFDLNSRHYSALWTNTALTSFHRSNSWLTRNDVRSHFIAFTLCDA